MAQWNSIEDETGMTYVTTSPHFAWENGHAAFRTDDVDVSAAVIDGRLLKVIVADGDGALGDMTSTNFTYAAPWTFASHTFTRTAAGTDLDVVHDTAAVAGTMYQVNVTCTRSAGNLTPQVGGVDTTAIALSGSYTYYVVATDTTAPTLQADASFAGTVTNFSVYALDLTGWALATDWALTCSADGGTFTYTYTAGTNETAVKITIDDIGGDSMTVGKLYKMILKAGNATDDTTTLGLYNSGDELIDTLTVPVTDADITWYWHYEAGMYISSTAAADGDTLAIDITSWHNYEVERLGTDALVIMNGDGEKYQWDSFGTDFDKNSDAYTFDIYEMRGGVAGETRLDTWPQTFSDQGLLSRATSRDSSMEYPDHKDMEDFD
jgi:hypothetical protein